MGEPLPKWYPRSEPRDVEKDLLRQCVCLLDSKLIEASGREETLKKQLTDRDAIAELLKSHLDQVTSEVKSILTKALNPEPQLPPVLRSEFERIIRDGLVNNVPLATIEKQLHWEARAYQHFLDRQSRKQI